MTSLSIVIIAKNNEKTIDDALRSAKGLSNDIVVVDTGSKDRTLLIARGYGAKIVQCPHPFDYSKARNIGNEAATGEWVFHLDTDELFDERQAEIIHHAISKDQYTQYLISQLNYEEGVFQVQERLQPRLFKRTIHSHVGLSFESLTPPSTFGHLDAFIEHHPNPALDDLKMFERLAFSITELEMLKHQEPKNVIEAAQIIERLGCLRGPGFDMPELYLLVAKIDAEGVCMESSNEVLALRTANFFGRAGWYDEALETLSRISLDTARSHVYFESLAVVQSMLGRVPAGLTALTYAIKQYPCARYYCMQSLFLTKLGDKFGSIHAMEHAIDYMPLHPHYTDMLALLKTNGKTR